MIPCCDDCYLIRAYFEGRLDALNLKLANVFKKEDNYILTIYVDKTDNWCDNLQQVVNIMRSFKNSILVKLENDEYCKHYTLTIKI